MSKDYQLCQIESAQQLERNYGQQELDPIQMKQFRELRDQMDQNNLECVGRIKQLEAECKQKTALLESLNLDIVERQTRAQSLK